MAKPWEILKDESSKAYEAFCRYREIGVDRSIAKVAKQRDPNGTELTKLEFWSSKYKWVERARAYDAELERQKRLEYEKARRDMNARHVKLALMGQSIAAVELKRMLDDIQQGHLKLSLCDIALLVKLSIKMEREARGELSGRVV